MGTDQTSQSGGFTSIFTDGNDRLFIGRDSTPPVAPTPHATNVLAPSYRTTQEVVTNVLGASQVLCWLPNKGLTVDSRRNADWEASQTDLTTLNTDGSNTWGFWFPNVAATGPAFANADYMFRADGGQAYSGNGYLAQTLYNPYSQSYACQNWRTSDSSGVDLPSAAYYSCRMRFHEPLAFDNGTDPDYGFTQNLQIYALAPAQKVLLGVGAGLKNGVDPAMRWYFSLNELNNFDVTQINPPPLPLNQWVHMEFYFKVDTTSAGVLQIWQDGQLVVDYAGATVANTHTRWGISWGVYGHRMTNETVHVDYDEQLISKAPVTPYLILPSWDGGLGGPGSPAAAPAQATGTASDATTTHTGNTNVTPSVAMATGTATQPGANLTSPSAFFTYALAASVTTASFTAPAGSRVVAITRAGRNGWADAYNWAFSDSLGGTWVRDATGPENGTTFGRQSTIAHRDVGGSPATMTVTVAPWQTASVGILGLFIYVLPAGSFHPTSWLPQTPNFTGTSTGGGPTTPTLAGAATQRAIAVGFSEDGSNSVWSPWETGWVAKAESVTTYYGGQLLEATGGDASGSTPLTYSSPGVNTVEAVIFEVAAAVVIDQAAYRWGADDGSESAHTFAAAQNTALTSPTGTNLLRFLLQATGDPAATAWKLQHQTNGAGGYADTPIGSGTSPSLTTVNAGTVVYSAASGSTSVAPAYPAGLTANDAIVLVVGMKPITANLGSVTTPTGYTSQASLTGAGGFGSTVGNDQGNTNVWVFTKNTVTGTESGTLTVALTNSPDVAWAVLIAIPAGAAATWSFAAGTGEDQAAGNVSIVTGSVDIAAGDLVLAGMVIPTDVATPTQFSAEALAQTGTTFGTVTEIIEPDTTIGADLGGFLVWAPVSSGSGSGAVTLTATAGGTTTNVKGPGFVFRLRATGFTNSVYVAPSSNFAGGGEATTQRLTGGTGTFTTGRRWDDENGTDTIDIGTNGNTELEWALGLAGQADGDFVDFRLTPVDTFTATPRWTVGAGSTSTNVNAGNAVGTGTASAPSVSLATPGGVAQATGTGSAATAATNVPAGNAFSSGTGQSPGVNISAGQTVAQATGTAPNATASGTIIVNAGNAAAVGTAPNATTKAAPTAGVAQAAGTAPSPTPLVAVPASNATGQGFGVPATIAPTSNAFAQATQATGTASNATTTSSGNAPAQAASGIGTASNAAAVTGSRAYPDVASATGAASDATTRASGNVTPTVAAGLGTAYGASDAIGSGTGTSAGTGTATNGTTKASGNAFPTAATAQGTAYNGSAGTNTSVNPTAAQATGTAYNEVGRYIAAAPATATGAASDSGVSDRVAAGTATAQGTAPVPAGSLQASPATTPAGTGTAGNATTRSDANLQPATALATGTAANTQGISTRTAASNATGSGVAANATTTKMVPVPAGAATATGAAYNTTVNYAVRANAEGAFAVGVARDPVVYVVAPGTAFPQVAQARGAAWGADRRPIFVGGVPVLLEPQTLTVITPAQTGPDGFGNTIWDYGITAGRRDIMGWIQQDQRSEGALAGRDPSEERWLLITDDPGITARDWIYWGTHPLGPQTFQVEGPPEPAYRPSGFHHLEATLRQVVG